MSLPGVRLGRCVLCGHPCDGPLCRAHSDVRLDAVPPDPLTSLPMQDDEADSAWERENRRVLGA